MTHCFRNIHAWAALLIAGAAFAACQPDEPQQETPKTYTMTVLATKGSENDSTSDGSVKRVLSLDGHTLNASWATTEHVYVKKGSVWTWATGSLQPQTAGVNTTLDGSLTIDGGFSVGEELMLQFPRIGVQNYGDQVGTLADIAAKYDFATATVHVASISDGHITISEDYADFQNQQAIVKFTLIDKADGTTPLNATQFVIGDGSRTFTATPASATNVLYMALPGFSNKNVTLSAIVDGDLYTYEKSNVTFTHGKYYEITAKMTKNSGWTYSYTGAVQTFKVQVTGYYTLECYGAQGGSFSSNRGGYGGTSQLTSLLTRGDVLYLYVGGQGVSITNSQGHPEGGNGGWNGGGKGGTGIQRSGSGSTNKLYSGGGGGGGATHISTSAIGPISSSTDFTSNHANLLLIAGGGGGGSGFGEGGSGGGAEGGVGSHRWSSGEASWDIDWNNGTYSCGKNGMTSTNASWSAEGCGGGGAGFVGGNTWTVTNNAQHQSFSGAGGSSWGETTNGKGYSTTSGGATEGGNGKAVITWYGTTYPKE